MSMDRKMTWRVFGSQTLVVLALFVNVATASDNTVERPNTLSRPIDQDGHLVGRTSPNLRPVIQYLSARLYGSYLIVSGNLTNVTGDPTKWTVLLSGSILGTAPVQPDGSFSYVTDYGYSYGEVAARAVGPNGVESARATTEIYP